MDVVSAYLAGELTEEVWKSPPEGVTAPKGEYCRLRKSLYGLKQAARVWFQLLTGYLERHGYQALPAEPSMMTNQRVIIAIYVDDMLITGASIVDVEEAKELLRKRFEVTDLGEARVCLGIRIHQDRAARVIYIDQSAYAYNVVEAYLPKSLYPAPIPMRPGDAAILSEGRESTEDADIEWYRGAVGSLMHLVHTRPDLTFSIHRVAQLGQHPKSCHKRPVEQILRYVKGTTAHGIYYRADAENAEDAKEAQVFSDSDFAGDPVDRRSTIGCVVKLHGGAVYWYSRKIRSTILQSTTEAEYIGLSEAGKEAIWVRRLLANIQKREEEKEVSISLYGDNQAALRIAEPGPGPKTKHLSVKYHFIRDLVETGVLRLDYCSSGQQLADGFTKALPQASFLHKQKELAPKTGN